MGSKHDIENLTASTYSEPLKTPMTKLEVIPPNDVDGDTFYVTTNRNKYFLNGSLKFYRGILMDPFLTFWKEQTKNFQKIYTFTSLWCIVFQLWLFVLRPVATPQKCL